MDRAEVVELLSQNAAVLKEDIRLIEAGTIKFTVFGADVTRDLSARLRGNLARIEVILDALEENGDWRSTKQR